MIRDTHKAALSDEASRRQIVNEAIANGYVTIPHIFDDASEQRLIELRTVIGDTNKKNEQLVGTFGEEIRHSDEIFEMCTLIHKTRCEITGEKFTPLSRDKQSVGIAYKNSKNESQNVETEYHYDAAYINIVIPISLPPREKGDGNLVLFPNFRRKYPRIIAAPLSSLLRRSQLARSLYGYKVVDYSVGSMHLFFGDISLHGVEPLRHGERMIMAINSHW